MAKSVVHSSLVISKSLSDVARKEPLFSAMRWVDAGGMNFYDEEIWVATKEVFMTTDLFDDAERRMQKAVDALKHDLGSIRTGRASSALLERIQVDYYGTPMPINQVATVTVPEARLLVIQPWEKKMLTDIEKAIQKSDLGINPNNDGQVIRLAIPPMNEERRRDLVKTLHKKLDEHKVAVRNVRRDIQDKLRDREKKKEVSEDELKRSTDRLQKLTDRYIDEMDKVGKAKEQEILEV